MSPTKSATREKRGIRRKTSNGFKKEAAFRRGTKATTTPLVNHFFQSIFFDQMNQNVKQPPCYDSFIDLEEIKPCVVLLEKLDETLETKIPAEKENIDCNFSKADKMEEKKTPSSRKFMTTLKENVKTNTPELNSSIKRKKPDPRSVGVREHLRDEKMSVTGNSKVCDIISSPAQNRCEVTTPESKSSRKSRSDLMIGENNLSTEVQSNTSTLRKESKSEPRLRRSLRTDNTESQNGDYDSNSLTDENCFEETVSSPETNIPKKVKMSGRKSIGEAVAQKKELACEDDSSLSDMKKNRSKIPVPEREKIYARKSITNQTMTEELADEDGSSSQKATPSVPRSSIRNKSKDPESRRKSVTNVSLEMDVSPEKNNIDQDSTFESHRANENVLPLKPGPKRNPKRKSVMNLSMEVNVSRKQKESDLDSTLESNQAVENVPALNAGRKRNPKRKSIMSVSMEVNLSSEKNNIAEDSTFESNEADENVPSLIAGRKRNPKRKSVMNDSLEKDVSPEKNNIDRNSTLGSNEVDKNGTSLKIGRKRNSKRPSLNHKEDLTIKKRKLNNVESEFCSSPLIGGESYQVGDFISVRHKREIGLIKNIGRANDEQIMCHVQWFIRSADTILGEVGNHREIFLTDACEDMNLNEVNEVLNVSRLLLSNWDRMGSLVLKAWSDEMAKENPNALFYQKRYEPKVGHFTTIPETKEKSGKCSSCEKKEELKNYEIPLPVDLLKFNEKTKQCAIKAVRWRGQIFSLNTCVFLKPGSLLLPKPSPVNMPPINEDYDETVYPERYRKADVIEDDLTLEEPFDIGFICEIYSKKTAIEKRGDVHVQVKKFYRPHNTHLLRRVANEKDLNLLYWSDEECVVTFEEVEGKCFVTHEQNLNVPVEEWTSRGPHRFYFVEAFDLKTLSFIKPPTQAEILGDSKHDLKIKNVPIEWPEIPKPLNMMDVFAGCGGLTEGLQQSGVAICRWAIENCAKPAEAFKLNNEQATVFVEDCIDFLKKVKKGKNAKLPKRGDVELLVGGPPCTGLSKMGQPNHGDCLSFDNSLIGSYLSYCEYFRPRFVILENVRDFTSAAKGVIFKKSLNRLLEMGYQVSFTVLQCGKYGLPQSRRRAIIFAAGPGEVLPSFPEPTHAFPLHQNIDINVGGKKFAIDFQWTSGPYRATTVADALSDLPDIFNDEYNEEMIYKVEPKTHFQAMARGTNCQGDDVLIDHICKRLTDLNYIRAKHIPRKPVGDWRDLPNIEVQLPDDTFTEILKYTHRDSRNGNAKNGDFRGVCSCASRKKGTKKSVKCNPAFRQTNTLIPWCLPHTGNDHNNWSGLFGRVGWNGYFRTVVSHPEPMGKQGRVIHPIQDRVFSVRECARSQGLPDSFRFYGSILDKYTQIGNAVTPPLAKALGYEIRKSVAERTSDALVWNEEH